MILNTVFLSLFGQLKKSQTKYMQYTVNDKHTSKIRLIQKLFFRESDWNSWLIYSEHLLLCVSNLIRWNTSCTPCPTYSVQQQEERGNRTRV